MAASENLIILNMLTSVFMISAVTIDSIPLDIQQDLSMQTLFTSDLNHTHYFKKFGIKDMESAVPSRRARNRDRYAERIYWSGPEIRQILKDRMRREDPYRIAWAACLFIDITYRAAVRDLTTYFGMRQLYLNTLEFEVGYMVNQIVYHYETILEFYHIIISKFQHRPSPLWYRNLAPPQYMFFMYKQIVSHATQISHLIDMLHELPKKYASPGQTVWDDYHLLDRQHSSLNASLMIGKEIAAANLRRLKARQKRQKRRLARQNKKIKRLFGQNALKSTWKWKGVTRKPYKSKWPLIYGWSIELDW